MINFLKVSAACLLVLGVMGYLVDYMNKVQAEPQITMCRITDINNAVHQMPCEILASYVNEANK